MDHRKRAEAIMPNYLDAGFGVELECFLPEGGTQQQAAAAVAQRLGAPCNVQAYGHSVPSNWKVVTDGSLGDYVRGVEFVSPILRGEDGLAQVEKVCRALTDFGCTVNKKCGFHVHVGVGAPELRFFKNLVRLYAMYEPVLDSVLPPSRRASTNAFCRSMTSALPAAIEAATSLNSLMMAIGNAGRYYKLNLAAYARHRTVEFRQHSGTLDAVKARNWTVLCLRMVAKAMDTSLSLGGTVAARTNQARPGTKAWRIGQMFLRPEGVTGREVMQAMNWPSVSMPQQARACGIEFTTQRMGREVRYFARAAVATASAPTATPITVEGLAALIGLSNDERAFFAGRARDLQGAVAWAA
jgi:hypothetical protein